MVNEGEKIGDWLSKSRIGRDSREHLARRLQLCHSLSIKVKKKNKATGFKNSLEQDSYYAALFKNSMK
jgi:hypothetical protein